MTKEEKEARLKEAIELAKQASKLLDDAYESHCKMTGRKVK